MTTIKSNVSGQQIKSGWGSFETSVVSGWDTGLEANAVSIAPEQTYRLDFVQKTVDYSTARRAIRELEAQGIPARIVDAGYVATSEMYGVHAAYPLA